jgi:hypothetical protein
MKPDQKQQLQLQDYLGKNLRYRETYAEFYDHILSALEAMPNDGSFDEVSHKIIEENFGGITGMRLIEQKYQRSVFTEMQKKYFSYAKENLKFPLIILWVAFTVASYYLFKQPWFTFMEFLVLVIFIWLIPFALRLFKQLHTAKATGAPKKSIKSGFFNWLNRGLFMPIFLWLLAQTFRSADPEQATLTEVFMTIFCLVVALHTFNFYRVYKDDIRTSFTTN